MLKIWMDCEFTSLDERRAELLSVGLVAGNGAECYVELLDATLRSHCSTFTLDTVLPLFGLMPGAGAKSYVELATRVTDYLVAFGEPVAIVYDYNADRELLEHALRRASAWGVLEERIAWQLAPADVLDLDAAQEAMANSWWLSELEGLARHHALADARALRAACLTVESR